MCACSIHDWSQFRRETFRRINIVVKKCVGVVLDRGFGLRFGQQISLSIAVTDRNDTDTCIVLRSTRQLLTELAAV